MFLQSLNESVTSVQGGVVATQGFDEIVCATYAGMSNNFPRVLG